MIHVAELLGLQDRIPHPTPLRTRFGWTEDLRYLTPGHLTVVCGPSGIGTSALLLGLALAVAEEGQPVACFSLRESERAVAARITLMEIEKPAADLPLWLRAAPNLAFEEIVTSIEAAATRPLLVVVDPITGVQGSNATAALHGLRRLARQERFAVLAARPTSFTKHRSAPGGVMRSADIVSLLGRPSYYSGDENRIEEARLRVVWNAQGPLADIRLRWQPARAAFLLDGYER